MFIDYWVLYSTSFLHFNCLLVVEILSELLLLLLLKIWNYSISTIGNIGHVSASPRVVQELPVLIEWICFSARALQTLVWGVGVTMQTVGLMHCFAPDLWVFLSPLLFSTLPEADVILCYDKYEYVDCLGLAGKKWGCSAGCGGSIGHLFAWNWPQRCAWNSTLPWDTYYYFVTRPCRYVIHLGWATEHKLC